MTRALAIALCPGGDAGADAGASPTPGGGCAATQGGLPLAWMLLPLAMILFFTRRRR
jgi:MYXO-CTERM domain-containing protein